MHFERPRIDYSEELAFPDLLAFAKCNLGQLPVDAALDADRIQGCYRSQALQIYRHVLLLSRGNRYRDWLIGGSADVTFRIGRAATDGQREDDNDNGKRQQ